VSVVSHCAHPVASRLTGTNICSECLPSTYGPGRNETLDAVEQRLARQVTAQEIVMRLAESLANHPGRPPIDAARNMATWLLNDYLITRRP